MQSFLAYRRFGRTVQQQLARDRQKAEALERGNAEASFTDGQDGRAFPDAHRASSIDSTTTTSNNDSRLESSDLEKGKESTGYNAEDGEATLGNGIAGDHEISRAPTNRTLIRSDSFGTRMGNALTGIEVRSLTREIAIARTRSREHHGQLSLEEMEKGIGKEKVFVVGYESEKDPLDPHNWSLLIRIRCTLLIASIAFIVGYASAVDSAALTQAAAEFGVSEVAEICATGLFLVGFGVGALFAGPISETVGRNPVYIVTMFVFMCWTLGAALAPNLGTQLFFRFCAGLFGATPLTCAGGSISDLWSPMERVYAFPVFANAAFMGPIFGPICGGFIGQYASTWRWTEWSTLITSGVILICVFLFQPETYAPILLSWKASHLRKHTGDDRYVAEIEIRADPFWTRLLHALYRPIILTVKEPIVILFALYLTVVYIILFTFLDGYEYIFGETYGFSESMVGLAFLGIAIGLCFASLWIPLIHKWAKRDLKKVQELGGTKLPPEKRLWFAMFGAPAIPIALFWMAWTNYPSVSYWNALVASVLFGYGILCIFISTYQYIIDSYELYAASALASLTLVRYVAAGAMTIVGIPFYRNVGVHWTVSILGFISLVMVPVPYIFYVYGPKIRGWSSYAAK